MSPGVQKTQKSGQRSLRTNPDATVKRSFDRRKWNVLDELPSDALLLISGLKREKKLFSDVALIQSIWLGLALITASAISMMKD